MEFEQTCPCGAAIKVDYAPHAVNVREQERQAERSEARKLIAQWRAAHRPCLKRLGEASASASPGFDIDDHDDETERRLIVRIQNKGLLRAGLTVTDVRSALDG